MISPFFLPTLDLFGVGCTPLLFSFRPKGPWLVLSTLFLLMFEMTPIGASGFSRQWSVSPFPCSPPSLPFLSPCRFPPLFPLLYELRQADVEIDSFPSFPSLNSNKKNRVSFLFFSPRNACSRFFFFPPLFF